MISNYAHAHWTYYHVGSEQASLGLELVPVGIRNSRNVSYQPSLVIRSVANKSYMPSKCLLYLSGVAGWVGGWVGGHTGLQSMGGGHLRPKYGKF